MMRRLPFGGYTEDGEMYALMWSKVGEAVAAKFPGFRLIGMDPDILIGTDHASFTLPQDAVQALLGVHVSQNVRGLIVFTAAVSPFAITPVEDPTAVEDALEPFNLTAGDSWTCSQPEDRLPDGRWVLRLWRMYL
jgi:hypothetical protein